MGADVDAQLIAALFGRLPADQQATLGETGKIAPDPDPWAARWDADLWELEPFDERELSNALVLM